LGGMALGLWVYSDLKNNPGSFHGRYPTVSGAARGPMGVVAVGVATVGAVADVLGL
jgi:hypothetical protein